MTTLQESPPPPIYLEGSDHTGNNDLLIIDPSTTHASPSSFQPAQHLEASQEDQTAQWGQTAQAPDAGSFLESRFNALAQRWRSETGGISLTDRRVMHPAYQQIIGLGPQVIPIILRELQVRPDYWFWALRALTGENPVREEDAGRLPRMVTAWVNWGQDHRHPR